METIELLKLEKSELEQIIEGQSIAASEAENHIRNYQGKVAKHAQFVAENTCLDPLIFWSGYLLAVIIVFIVCLIAVIRHQRKNKKPVQKPVQTMERIQVADIEHSHLKAISSPNI